MNRILWGVAILFICNVLGVYGQNCSSSCSCNGGTAVCSDIDTFPTAFPMQTRNLTIIDSPSFTAITSIPNGVTSMYIINTGLESISSSAIANARGLQVLHLERNADLTELDLGEPTSAPDLTTLYVSKSGSLEDVKNINEYENLQSITISSCNLQKIDDEMFEDLEEVTYLDVSDNRNLKKIDKDAFEDLDALEHIDMSNCSLRTLYPDYFDNAYHKELKYVRTLNNPLQCLQLCDFMQWYWGHKSFYSYAYIGSCSIYSYGTYYYYLVLNLNRYEAGCPTAVGVIIGATLGSFFFICIVACILVLVCGINYRKYCCFCCESKRNQNENANNDTENNRDDPAVVYGTVPYLAAAEKSPYTFAAAPPSYEDITRELEREPVATITMPEEPSTSAT